MERLPGPRQALVIAGESAEAGGPAEAARDHPAAGQEPGGPSGWAMPCHSMAG
jgi:hypothetical protein